MGKLRLKNKKEFDSFCASGLRAMKSNKYDTALKFYTEADTLARHHNDRRRRLDALNPLAYALWSLGQYDSAKQKLNTAMKIASELAMRDEVGIVLSNLGRLTAVKIIKETPVSRQAKELNKKALPYFMKSQNILAGHDHLYFRYKNAKHGALIAALSQDYKKSSLLISEGLDVAFKKSRKFDKYTAYKISPEGMEYFATAAILVNLGLENPSSREYKNQEKVARLLVR